MFQAMASMKEDIGGLSASGVCTDANESSLGLLPASCLQDSLHIDEESTIWPCSSRVVPGLQATETQSVSQTTEKLRKNVIEDGDDEVSGFEIELDMEELNNLEADFSDFSEDNLVFYSGDRSKHEDERAGSSGSSVNDIGPRAGQGVGCAMESRSTSEADTEDEIRAVLGQDGSRAVTFLPRPGLEGQSSLDCSAQQGTILVERECAEGSIEVSPTPSGDGGGGGDGSSGHTSDSGTAFPSRQNLPVSDPTPLPGSSNTTFTRVGPLGNEDSAIDNDRSVRPNFTLDHTKFGSVLRDESAEARALGLRSHLLQPALNSMDDSYGIRPWGADESSFRLEHFAPGALLSRSGDGSEAGLSLPKPPSHSSKVNFSDDQISARSSSLGTAPSLSDRGGQVSSSTDIQMHQKNLDEEFGRLNPFDDAEILSFDRMVLDDEEFLGADRALAMFSDDEKLFEEEHKFRQDDPMRSISLGSSWTQPPTRDITRPSWMTDADDAESRVSFGQFLRSRTAALGSLDDKESRERPNFGGKVITPPRSGQPMPLIEVDSHKEGSAESNLKRDDSASFAMAAAEHKQSELATTEDPRQTTNNSLANETGVMSLSTISQLIAEASVSSDPQTMVDMIFKWSKQLQEAKRQPSQVQDGIISKAQSKTQSLPLARASRSPKVKGAKHSAEANKEYADAATTGAQKNLCLDPLDWKVIRPSSVLSFGSQKSDKDRPAREQLETPGTWRADEMSMHNQMPLKRIYHTSTPFQPHQPLPFNFSPSLVTLHSPPGTPAFNDTTPNPIREPSERGIGTNLVQSEINTQNNSTLVSSPVRMTPVSSFPLRNEMSSHVAAMPSTDSPRTSLSSAVSHSTASTVHAVTDQSNMIRAAFRPLEVDTTLTSDSKTAQLSTVPTEVLPRIDTYISTSVSRPQSSISTSRMSGTVSLQRAMALKLPEAVRFTEVVAVGIPAQTVLPLENPTAKWLQCSLEVEALTINEQHFPPQMSPFEFKKTIIVEPSSKEELKIVFDSRIPGQVMACLKISTEIMTSNQQGIQAFPTASVLLHAEAEHPNIQVLLGKQQLLDFGVLPEDSISEKSLGLVNVGLAAVPLRLVIHENSPAWQGFYFPKKNIECSSPPARQFESSRVLTCLLPGQAATSVPVKVVNFQVAFRAHGLDGTGDISLPVSSTLTLELDKPSVGNVLHTVPLKAVIGRAQLETVKNIEPLHLRACPSMVIEQVVPLRNSGSIPLVLELSVLHRPHLFGVSPHAMQISPGEESSVIVSFSPRELMPVLNNALLITICPGGLIYELQMIAETFPAIPVPEDFSLESDKQMLLWPGLSLGETNGQVVVLRNCSRTGPVQLHLQIHSAAEEFWLQVGPNLISETQIVIPSCAVQTVTTVYKPHSLAHSSSKLTIKPLQVAPSARSVRYVLPLFGYGATNKLEVVDAQVLSGVNYVDVGAVQCGTTTLYHLLLRNNGERAAFVKVLIGSAARCPMVPYPAEVIVSCNEMIVERANVAEIVVAIRSSSWNDNSNAPPTETCFGALSLFFGDEVSRRRYRRLNQDGTLPHLPSDHLLHGVNFNVAYDGEQLQEQEEDLPPTAYDRDMFFNGISTMCIWLVTQKLQLPAKPKVRPTHLPTSNLINPSTLRLMNPSSPPVREVQPGWNVTPKELKLTVVEDSCSVQAMTFSLVNSTARPLSFQIMWPAHLLSLSPAEGSIPARKSVTVCVRALPSKSIQLNTRREATVVVKCAKQQQEVNVTITKTASVVPTAPTTLLSPVKVATKEIIFPNTPVGQSSEFRMEMSNTSPVAQHWALTPTSVGQFKKVKSEGSASSLTYSVFRFAEMSGRLNPEQTTEVPVTFLPLECGDFSQSWNMTSRDANRKTHQICIELHGICHAQSQAQVTKAAGRKIRQKVGQNQDRPVCSPSYTIEFPVTKCKTTACAKLPLHNISTSAQVVSVKHPKPPFFINHSVLTLRERHYVRLPIHFKPNNPGTYCDTLTIDTNLGYQLEFQIFGRADNDIED